MSMRKNNGEKKKFYAVRILILIPVIFYILSKVFTVFIYENFLLYNIGTPFFKPIQFLTCLFIGDIWSVLFNILIMYTVGRVLEECWGSVKLLLYYFISGIGALLVAKSASFFVDVIKEISSDVFLGTGALGLGCYSLLLAYAVMFPNMRIRLSFLSISIRVRNLILIVLLLFGLFEIFANSASSSIVTLVISFIILRFWTKKRCLYTKLCINKKR